VRVRDGAGGLNKREIGFGRKKGERGKESIREGEGPLNCQTARPL